MSRSNNTTLPNPASRFYRWDGENGGLIYFDKTLGEKGEKVHVDLPFQFIVLDTLSTIKGYNDFDKSGFWSNEVRDIRRDTFVVRTKGGVCATGTYDEVKAHKACTGCKYCQSVYICHRDASGFNLSNIQMTGSALSAWIDFRKKHNVMVGGVEITGFTSEKKGATKYKKPTFSATPVNAEDESAAIDMDIRLQQYFDTYFKKTSRETNVAVETEVVEGDPAVVEESSDSLPF